MATKNSRGSKPQIVREFNEDSIDKVVNRDEGNTSKNQIHLGLGSGEYKERVSDLQTRDAVKPVSEFHKDLVETYGSHKKDLSRSNRALNERASAKIAERRLYKANQEDEVLKTLAKNAAKTETLEDDLAVENFDIESIIVDDSKSKDDFVPKVLSKYID